MASVLIPVYNFKFQFSALALKIKVRYNRIKRRAAGVLSNKELPLDLSGLKTASRAVMLI